jgi:hypothetical protein
LGGGLILTKEELKIEKTSSLITLEIYKALGSSESFEFEKHKEIISNVLSKNKTKLDMTNKAKVIIEELEKHFNINNELYNKSIIHTLMTNFLREY